MLRPLVTPAAPPLRVASNYLGASSSTGGGHLPDQSELAGASTRAEAGVLGISESVSVGELEDEGAADAAVLGQVTSTVV